MSRRLTLIVMLVAVAGPAHAGSALWIGSATADITPERPVALSGQIRTRISTGILSRVTANVLALEARDGDKVLDQAILVSCDLCNIRPGIQEGFREHLKGRLPGVNLDKLVLAATHTHEAPVLLQDRYQGYGNAMQPKEYVPFFYGRIAQAVEKAWKARAPGAVAWGLGHAAVGVNRRVVFRDGSAVTCGRTNTPEFRGVEGYEDHAVDILFFYDEQKKLKAAAITLVCPAQAVGSSRSTKISADFWHDVRSQIQQRHGNELCVLGFCGPSGDQGPKPYAYRVKSERRMERLRGLTRAQEIGRRIANAFTDVLAVVQSDIRTDVPMAHRVLRLRLPGRKVTEDEFAAAKSNYDELVGKTKLGDKDYVMMNVHKTVLDRYQAQQKADPVVPVEVHALRLGEVAIATNPFELFVDYGVRIQAGSPAEQTVLIQLATSLPSDYGVYLPTERAARGRGYSATVSASLVGPEGGQILVERTVEAINELWMKPDVLRAFRRQSEETFSLAGHADRAGWFQVDLKPHCNMNLYSDAGVTAPVKFHAMALGRREFYGVPLDIITPAENDNKTALALPSRRYLADKLPEEVEIPIGREAKVLYFLYATYYTLPKGEQCFRINYALGDAHVIPFVGTKQSGDWYHVHKRVYSDNVRHVLIPQRGPWHNRSFYCMHLMQWENPEPDREIESVTLKSDRKAEMAIFVAAITGHSGKGGK